jgi:hypothetical protein
MIRTVQFPTRSHMNWVGCHTIGCGPENPNLWKRWRSHAASHIPICSCRRRLEAQHHEHARYPYRDRREGVADWERNSGQREDSFRERRQFSLSIRSESKTHPDVFSGEIGELFQEFFLGHAAGQVLQNIGDCHPGSTNARLAASLAGFNGYDIFVFYD